MDTAQIQIAVFDHKPPNPWLKTYIARFAHAVRVSDILDDEDDRFADFIAIRRNRVAAWFLAETDLAHLLMIDHDHIPGPELDPLIASEADVVGAEYIRGSGNSAHPGDGEAGAGCLRISRVALERIPPPWFAFITNDRGTAIRLCECGYFCNRARAAGYHPVKAGAVDHIIPMAARPIAGDQTKAHVTFIKDISAPTSAKCAAHGTHHTAHTEARDIPG